MAVFKVPRITSAQRSNLLLQEAELVFDTDQKAFYGGDNVETGGFLVGEGIGKITSNITLTNLDISNKFIILSKSPLLPESVTLVPAGGIQQVNGIDFEVVGNELRWNGLGLDGFLEENDVLIVQH